jgi:phosphatidylserine/phosphatidylglycerophosphate/cardiolipin synthase-like enzyme
LAVETSGHVVQVAANLFETTWKSELEHRRLEFIRRPLGFGNTQIIGNNHLLDRWKHRRSLLYAMGQAEQKVEMINPYFLPAPDLLSLFRRLIKRGIKVTVIVPKESDIVAVNLATEIAQRRFLRRNVEILRYPDRLHAKAILVDGKWASIGSYNFDYQSLFRNLEVVLNTTDEKVTQKLSEMFDKDRKKSVPLTLDHWKNMPFFRKIAARILYRLRRFL